MSFEYELKKKDSIAAIEALERDKILRELDDELRKEIEEIRAHKSQQVKSSTFLLVKLIESKAFG